VVFLISLSIASGETARVFSPVPSKWKDSIARFEARSLWFYDTEEGQVP
jgi:hypothetical protein